MQLKSPDGSSLRLEIRGYQFPSGTDQWLMIRIEAASEGEAWSAVDPALEVSDAEHLATWLDRINSGESVARQLHFTEPNLMFEVEGQPELAVRVHFDLEFLPESKVKRGYAHREPFSIRFPVKDLELPVAVASLRDQLARLPRRSHGPI